MRESGATDLTLKAGFASVDRVVADPVRFKLRLGIGEDAYTSLRLKNNVLKVWDIGSWGGTGAAVASSKVVASTFFAPTGFMALIGLGTAATPVGWVVAAAVTSAGAYYGVTRLFGRYAGSRVDTIPKFINTPIDVLGAALLDLMGGLAIRVAAIDGYIDNREIETIVDHFVADWGMDRDYVEQALSVFQANIAKATIKELAGELAKFMTANPDCNATAMSATLTAFLRDIATADGRIDEREDLAIDAIAGVIAQSEPGMIARLGDGASRAWSATTDAVAAVAQTLPEKMKNLNPLSGKQANAGGDDA
jgi:tellurite resistance protein